MASVNKNYGIVIGMNIGFHSLQCLISTSVMEAFRYVDSLPEKRKFYQGCDFSLALGALSLYFFVSHQYIYAGGE